MCASEMPGAASCDVDERPSSILMRSSGIRPATEERDQRSWRKRIADWLLVRDSKNRGFEPGPLIEPEPGRIGICCSGGGIRSAAYNLGALQVLDSHQVLGRAQFLASVSGGSYIAGSLATIASASQSGTLEPPEKAVYAPGSPEERHLRNNSSYLAPGISGRVRLLLRMVFGMGVNLLFIASALCIAGVLYGWFLSSPPVHPELKSSSARTLHLGLGSWAWVLVPAFVGVALAFFELTIKSSSEKWSTPTEAWSARMLQLALFLLFFTIAVPALLMLLHRHSPAVTLQGAGKAVGASSSSSKCPPGCAAQTSGFLKLINVSALLTAALGAVRAFLARKKSFLALFAGAVAGPLAIFAAFLGFASEAAIKGPNNAEIPWLCAAGVLLLYFLTYADLTQWSLHPFYRRRLSTAFFVSRRRVKRSARGTGETVRARPLEYKKPYAISNLTPGDGGPLDIGQTNVQNVEIEGERTLDAKAPPGGKAQGRVPELLICAAANISDRGATPPGRNVIPFLFSARELGGPLVGAMGTKEYEEKIGKNTSHNITLPAAVAMSGAAVAPSMGKKSVRALTFLLALTNLRLGVWLPNPRWAGELKPRPFGKRVYPPAWYLLHELLGRHKLDHKYLYITDGGHYENLGLIELLRRGCTLIYCLDASGDQPETFTTLGEAIALARSEVGVDIEIDPTVLRPPASDDPPATDHAIGSFRYRTTAQEHEGTLVFCKTAVTADAPWDVRAFKEKDKLFPNDSIFDQLFNDEKFEAYRALGARTTERALASLHENLLKRETHRILVDKAREQCTIAYEDLNRMIRKLVPDPNGDLDLRAALTQIAEEEKTCGRPPLVALVEDDIEVSSTELWEQAKQIGLGRLPAGRLRRRRLRLVHAYWSANASNGSAESRLSESS
jgi:hypothetical protein